MKTNFDDVTNKCTDCELKRLVINIKTQNIKSYCPYCPNDEELGNNAEVIPNYPDDDPMDLATDKFLDEFQRGEH